MMRQIKSLLLDLLLIATATLLALYLRDNLELSAKRFEMIAPYLAFTLLAAAIILPASGVTHTLWRFAGIGDYGKLAASSALIVAVALALAFGLNRLDSVMRSLPVVQLLLMTSLLVGLRLAGRAHRFRHERRREVAAKKQAEETVLVVGLTTVAELFLKSVAEHAGDRIAVAGIIGRNERQTGQIFRSYRVLGGPEEIDSVIRELEVHGVSIQRVVVAVDFDLLSEPARNAILALGSDTPVRIDFFAERLGFAEPRTASSHAREAHAAPRRVGFGDEAVDAHTLGLRRPYWTVKRAIDAGLAAAALVVALPAMLVIAAITFVTVGGPIVFWQQRPGRYGRPFRVFKFRTMRGAYDANGRRLPDEARETPFGRSLRATRLDELPQLFNILAGHMSFVGPRPLLDVDQLDEFRDRLWVRPGLTGWAQVNGGKSVSASDKMALDMWYIRNASFSLDCRIALLTLKMVLLGEQTNPLAVEQAWLDLGRRY